MHRRLDRAGPLWPGARIAATVALGLAGVLLACERQPPPDPTAERLSASPEIGQELEATAGPFEFDLAVELGANGLAASQRLEVLLFPTRGEFDWRGATLDGEAAPNAIDAAPFARASNQVDEPGGAAGIRITTRERLGAGVRIGIRFTVNALPARRYGMQQPARLVLPVRIYSPAGDLERQLDDFAWPLATETAAHLRLQLPSQARVGDPVPLVVSLLSEAFNPAWEKRDRVSLALPEHVQGPASFPLRVRDRGNRTVALRFEAPGVYRIEAHAPPQDGREALHTVSNPIAVTTAAEPVDAIYWGDLHNHTRYSFDSRNRNLTGVRPAEEIELARDGALLDFLAITDHGQNGLDGGDWSKPTASDMPAADWRRYANELLAAKRPDLQVYVGYEHNDARGHTCMIFRHRGRYFIENGRRLDHRAVWERQEAGSLLSIPHLHPLRGIDGFRARSPHETLVEIYSKWGPYEYYRNADPPYPDDVPRGPEQIFDVHERAEKGPFARDLLAAGRRLGFVASSDHGPPGRYGLTAVYAASNDRDAIFDALLDRRTYATTGARMRMSFVVAGASMGRIVEVAAGDAAAVERTIAFSVAAAQPIDRFSILRNGETWYEERGVGALDLERNLVDRDPLAEIARNPAVEDERAAEYYLRVVQSDGHIGWSSPVWFVLR